MPNRRKATSKRASKNSRKRVNALSVTDKFKVLQKDNPRYKDTRAYKSYGGMLGVSRSRGYVFTLELLKAKKVDYGTVDARSDLKHGYIKKVG